MKKIAKLNALPAEDQKLILDLCEKHTYPEVVAILAKPRAEGGLDLETNRSALSRFNQQKGWLHGNLELAQQSIDILKAHPDTQDILGSITHMMGLSVFRQMVQYQPYESYKQQLHAYFRLQRLKLDREKLNRSESQDATTSLFPGTQHLEPGYLHPNHPMHQQTGEPLREQIDPQPDHRKSACSTQSSPAQNLGSERTKSHESHQKTPVISSISQNSTTPLIAAETFHPTKSSAPHDSIVTSQSPKSHPSHPSHEPLPFTQSVEAAQSTQFPADPEAADLAEFERITSDPTIIALLVRAAASGPLEEMIPPGVRNHPAMKAYLAKITALAAENAGDPTHLTSLTPPQTPTLLDNSTHHQQAVGF